MAVGIKEIESAKKAINQFGVDLYDEVTGETKTLDNQVEKAFYGDDQVEAIKGYITKVNEAVGNLFKDMTYWTDALQKVYEQVYQAESSSVSQQVNEAASSFSATK